MDGATFVPPPVAAPSDLAIPPADLSKKEKAAWHAHAPLAIEQGTLVPATVPGFRELCQCLVHQAELNARIQRIGRTSAEAERLLKWWQRGATLLNSKMKDYKLTAFGKAETGGSAKPAAPANPWARVLQK
jgi:hypothetical protein